LLATQVQQRQAPNKVYDYDHGAALQAALLL